MDSYENVLFVGKTIKRPWKLNLGVDFHDDVHIFWILHTIWAICYDVVQSVTWEHVKKENVTVVPKGYI